MNHERHEEHENSTDKKPRKDKKPGKDVKKRMPSGFTFVSFVPFVVLDFHCGERGGRKVARSSTADGNL
jgi:hypothetical protein